MCSFVESLESKQKYPVLINWKLSSLSYFSNSGSTYASLITVSEFGFTLILPSSLYTPFSSSTIFSYRRISAFFAVGTDTQWIVPRTFLPSGLFFRSLPIHTHIDSYSPEKPLPFLLSDTSHTHFGTQLPVPCPLHFQSSSKQLPESFSPSVAYP